MHWLFQEVIDSQDKTISDLLIAVREQHDQLDSQKTKIKNLEEKVGCSTKPDETLLDLSHNPWPDKNSLLATAFAHYNTISSNNLIHKSQYLPSNQILIVLYLICTSYYCR